MSITWKTQRTLIDQKTLLVHTKRSNPMDCQTTEATAEDLERACEALGGKFVRAEELNKERLEKALESLDVNVDSVHDSLFEDWAPDPGSHNASFHSATKDGTLTLHVERQQCSHSWWTYCIKRDGEVLKAATGGKTTHREAQERCEQRCRELLFAWNDSEHDSYAETEDKVAYVSVDNNRDWNWIIINRKTFERERNKRPFVTRLAAKNEATERSLQHD